MRRLLLIRHARTNAVRRAAFPLDEPLDAAGLAAAARLAGRLGRGEAFCSAALRARQTAAAAGLDQPDVVPELGECDFGTWGGRTLAEVNEQDPAGVGAWMTDSDARPHGGETLAEMVVRAGRWLDAQALLDGRAVVVTHGGFVRAAIVHALGAPPISCWRIDVAPLSVSELHARGGTWTLSRANAEFAAGGSGPGGHEEQVGGDNPRSAAREGEARDRRSAALDAASAGDRPRTPA